MPSILHPCRGCGHRSMDECWTAARNLRSGNKALCLECHDECLPKPENQAPREYRPRA